MDYPPSQKAFGFRIVANNLDIASIRPSFLGKADPKQGMRVFWPVPVERLG